MSRLIARFDVAYPNFHLQVDVDVPVTGITAVFGQSGSGKTTLLRCLAGLERSPTGYMQVGDDIWQDESRDRYEPISNRRIGYVFQEPRLFPHFNVRSNLAYGFNRTPAQDRRLSLDQVVEVLGIGHLLERRPHKLSGGEQQRVAIGRALLTSPKLLLLDEPLSSLDSLRKREIMPFIQRLYKELKIPIVYVTHSLHEILQLAQIVVFLRGGKSVATGSLSDVFSRLDLHRYLGPQLIGAVIDTVVAEHEREFGLTRLEFHGHSLYVPVQTLEIGDPLRVHILSSDVSLSVGPAAHPSSALNILPATVMELTEADQSTVDVRLDVGCPLVASITRKSAVTLGLKPGQRLHAHIKSVALAEDMLE
ncbi:MAG TPA: molybdenum ABC transporter ATP-binding protein [Nitrospiraceae bacterium]|nr:molybdenum ABC transporter ATP-binding protein [Nitrospiraceae bacterium]